MSKTISISCDISNQNIATLGSSSWAALPPELLRDILVRIEKSEHDWPSRRIVVSCAAVCSSWREIVKEIVETPEVSGTLTLPISLKQPGPRENAIQCFIKRDRTNSTYQLFLGIPPLPAENGKFLLAARKCRRATSTDYIISLDMDDMSRASNSYVGKLRSNFLGTRFTVVDCQASNYSHPMAFPASARVPLPASSPSSSLGPIPAGKRKESSRNLHHHHHQIPSPRGTTSGTHHGFPSSSCPPPPHSPLSAAASSSSSSSASGPTGNGGAGSGGVTGSFQVASIAYELNVLGTRGPRRMQCTLLSIPVSSMEPGGSAPTPTELTPTSAASLLDLEADSVPSNDSPSKDRKMAAVADCGPLDWESGADVAGLHLREVDGPLILKNKAPRWHEQLQCWCLNFRGRVTVASVKNFQLVASPEQLKRVPESEQEKVILQFGKIGKDMFTMDYRYPLSAFQAFAICLSSFDTKLACE